MTTKKPWYKRVLDFIANKSAEGVGEIEDVVQHPIYPIVDYASRVTVDLYRGSWPDKEQLGRIKETFGCQTVVNLCSERKQDKDVYDAKMFPVNISIEDNTVPSNIAIVVFLNTVKRWGPVYVHCEAGKGRTGCMVAAYRVKVQGWLNEDALKEAEEFGLSLPAQKEFILGLRHETLA